MSYLELEEKVLAPYAVKSRNTRGRKHKEAEHPYRSPFQRDRDRVIHSSAFRRLEFKTQVFLPTESDYYRTRLTHTIEVAQISRTIARALSLNEELAEAIALAHDLGHPPFGHIGESILHNMMKRHGGFEHNRQSLRIVEHLETRYPGFPGLNLTHEVREGIAKHETHFDLPDLPLRAEDFPPMEVQIVNRADEITYACHDTDDGLKSGILGEETLRELGLCGRVLEEMDRSLGPDDPKMRRYHLVRMLIDAQVTDLLEQTRRNIEEKGVKSPDDVRSAGRPLVTFSREVERSAAELRKFLLKNFYQHSRIRREASSAKMYLTELFDHYLKFFDTLPGDIRRKSADEPPHRVVCDYIAGMTDRFAVREHRRLVRK
ncbi:MAG: deoxyguanosinetriphosphate triphosphohydrolase [bacterium]